MIYKKIINKENIDNKINSEADKIYYDILCDIANFTIKYRKENNISNKQLADELGITTSLVSRIESGNKNISIKTISKILAKANGKIQIIKNK